MRVNRKVFNIITITYHYYCFVTAAIVTTTIVISCYKSYWNCRILLDLESLTTLYLGCNEVNDGKL